MNNSYNEMHPNKDNINNFDEGITDLDIREKRLMYQYNGLSPRGNEHGYSLSLACTSGTDMMHSIGNVTAVVLQFILDLFPENTFKTALPSTRLAHRQLRQTPKQIRSQSYPMCLVSPRVSLSGLDNRLAAGSFATTTWSTTSNRFQNRSEMPTLFEDPQKKIIWRGKVNRVVVFFDFVLAFPSYAEQLQWASYLINSIPTDGGFFDIDTALEMAIPDGFLYETSRYAGIPVKDEKGNVSRFVDYLNMNSTFPISYMFSAGKHKDAFYEHYMTALLCNIGELNYSNGNKSNNLVDSDFPITFTLRCEFNTIGKYDLCVPNPGPFRRVDAMKNAIAIPIFSDVWNEKDFPLAYGWKVVSRPIIKLDSPDEREVYVGAAFSNELNELIDYHLEKNIPIDGLLCSVKLRENKCLIDDGYYVDWRTRTLVITNANFLHTYRLIIAVNKLYIQKTLAEMYGKN